MSLTQNKPDSKVLEIRHGQILVNDRPLIEDFSIQWNPKFNNFRLLLKYFGKGKDEAKPIDLSIDYRRPSLRNLDIPKLDVFLELPAGVALDPNFPDDPRVIGKFSNLKLTWHILKGGWTLTGNIDGRRIDKTTKRLVEILEVLKPYLLQL